jgi:NADPH:quinone reductase
VLQEIAELFGHPDFHVPIGGLHPLQDFKRAVANSWNRPDQGKQIFRM